MIYDEETEETIVIPLPLLLAIAAKLSSAYGGLSNINSLLLHDLITAIELELEQREARLH